MGLLDKLLGRSKKAAGDVTGDSSLRREGAAQERAGAAEDRASQHEDMAQEQRDQAAEARADQEQS
ncbi:MAG: CsbD family protein [Actinobacteria bacterium]|nr:MAG: CsbD family protein [Actinomycetota bacterium]